MKNSKFVFDKITKLVEQGLISSRDLANEVITILNLREIVVFKMELTSKDEFEILSKELKARKIEKYQNKKKEN